MFVNYKYSLFSNTALGGILYMFRRSTLDIRSVQCILPNRDINKTEIINLSLM